LLLCSAYTNSFSTIQNEIDSIKQLIKTKKTDSILIKTYLTLSSKYLNEDNDSALAYAEKALHFASSISNKKLKAVALFRIGKIHFNLGSLDKALSYCNQSLVLAKSIDYNLYIAKNYKLIGALYGHEKDYENALNYQYKALTIFQSKMDSLNLARTYDNIAVYHRKLATYDSSLFYLNLAIEINNKLTNYRSLSFNYNNMASLFLVKKEYDKAEEYYLKSIAIREKYNLTQDLLQSYNNLGNLFYNTKEYNKAIPYFNSCIKISKQIKIIRHLPLIYNNLSKTYYELGNYKLALEHTKNKHLYADRINSTETQILIANNVQEIKNTEEQYNKLLLQEEVKVVEKLILKKSVLIFILFLIALIALYIVIYSVKNYKLEAYLVKKEASLLRIQGTEKVLSEKESAAQKINAAQEILTTEIATLLNTEVTLELKKVLQKLHNYKLNNPESAIIIRKEQKHITESIHFIKMISANLFPSILEDLLLTKAVDKYLNKAFDSLNTQINFTYSSPEILNHLEKDLNHNIYRIIQELITNIIKYAKATIINIEINTNIDHLLLRIHDNGIGFNANDKNTGLGLNNIKHRAQLYNGNVIINTKKGIGTEILIKMNYKKA